MTVRLLVVVWAALVALLALTMASSFVLSGTPGLVASMLIAVAKAALIYWVFMHLRKEGGIVRLAALGVFAWLLILFGILMTDYATRDVDTTVDRPARTAASMI